MGFRVVLACIGLALVSACSSAPGGGEPGAASPTPQRGKVYGSLSIPADANANLAWTMNADPTRDQRPCFAAAGYAEVKDGAQVKLLDGAGAVLDFGELTLVDPFRTPDGQNPRCVFTFAFDDAPPGHVTYQIQAGNSLRGAFAITEADLFAPGERNLSLG